MTLDQAILALTELSEGGDPVAGEVRLHLEGPVARIQLHNPSAKHAVTLSMMVDLGKAVQRLSSWPGAVVILHAEGGDVFCAGGHLGDVLGRVKGPDAARTMCLAMSTILASLASLPAISIAWVHGLALGGGAELATATDFLFMAPRARVHFVHVALGIVPGWGGTGRLQARLGTRASLSVLSDAKPLGAEACVAIGLAEGIKESQEQLMERFVEPRIQRGTEALRALKRQVEAHRGAPSPAALLQEAESFAQVWGGPAHRKALAARGLV